MTYLKRVYEKDSYWEYEIFTEDTSPCVRQDCDPLASGFVRMTEVVANDRADHVIERFNGLSE